MRPHHRRERGRWTKPVTVLITPALVGLVLAGACGSYVDDWLPTPPAPSIGIQLGSGALSVTQGQSGRLTIVLSRGGGYAGGVALSARDVPGGVTVGFEPPVLQGDVSSSTLTLTPALTTPPGTYALTILGSGANVTSHSVALELTVTALGNPSFDVSLGQASLSMSLGEDRTVAVFVSRDGGFTGPVELKVTAAPPGVATILQPTVVTLEGFGSILTVSTGVMTVPGTYFVTVTGSALNTVKAATLTLEVTPAPPAAITLDCQGDDGLIWTVLGDSWTWPVRVWRTSGYTGVVTLSIEGLPPQATATFDPASLDAKTTVSTLTLSAPADAEPIVTIVTIRARGAGVPDATTVVRLAVFPPASE